jgi:hypothetical protein
VSQNYDRLAHDEEANAQTIASRRIKTGEGLEHSRHLVPGYADSSVIHVNADPLVGVPATDENTATRLCVFDGIADQVAQSGTEKQSIALNRSASRDRTNPDSLC